jgi:hypothetical protein
MDHGEEQSSNWDGIFPIPNYWRSSNGRPMPFNTFAIFRYMMREVIEKCLWIIKFGRIFMHRNLRSIAMPLAAQTVQGFYL